MSKIVDSFFGGAEKEAGKQQVAALGRGMEAIEEGTEQARTDLFDTFARGQESRRAGLQGALDVFGQSIPQQAQVFQEGNVAAQQALLAGLPQIRNAILGIRPDFSGLQPTRLPFDFQFNQTLPQTTDIPRGDVPRGTPTLTPEQLAQLFRGDTR